MNSKRIKKTASNVVKVSRKKVFAMVKSRHDNSSEKYSLINSSQLLSDSDGSNPSVNMIPKGFMAVYVGPHDRRFVIPTRYLSVPDFKAVMETTAEEFGYEQKGALRIPCDEEDFQIVLAACKFKCKSKSSSSLNSLASLYIL